MKMTVLQCGSIKLPAPAIYRDETVKYPDCLMMAKNPPEKLLTIPVYAFLIEHDNGKKILFDTGWSDKVRKHAISHLGIVNLSEKAILPDGQERNALAADSVGIAGAVPAFMVVAHIIGT